MNIVQFKSFKFRYQLVPGLLQARLTQQHKLDKISSKVKSKMEPKYMLKVQFHV